MKKTVDEVESPKVSPTPPKKTENSLQIDFPDAMRQVIAGRHVTKLEWNNPNIYVFLDDKLRIRLEDGLFHPLVVSDGDMLGDDWVVI